jgi:hypothetical protein
LFPDQDIRWSVITLPYKTTGGGIREKFGYITWVCIDFFDIFLILKILFFRLKVPDTLKRETFKASIKLKTNALTFGAPMSSKVLFDCFKNIFIFRFNFCVRQLLMGRRNFNATRQMTWIWIVF